MAEVPVARIAFDHLDLTRAQYHDQDSWQICDGESAVWAEVYRLIFQPGADRELKDDFQVESNVFDVLLLHRALFHPCVKSYRQLVLDHMANLFGPTSVTALWHGTGDLTDAELSELGFRLVAGSKLCLRLNMVDCRFDHREMLDVSDVVAPDSAEEWLETCWHDC